MRRLAEGAAELAAEVRGGEVRGAGERGHVERLAVARVDRVLRAQQVPRVGTSAIVPKYRVLHTVGRQVFERLLLRGDYIVEDNARREGMPTEGNLDKSYRMIYSRGAAASPSSPRGREMPMRRALWNMAARAGGRLARPGGGRRDCDGGLRGCLRLDGELLAHDHLGVVGERRRPARRALHAQELQPDGGEDPHLRRHPAVDLRSRPPQQGRERDARLRQPRRLRREESVLRLHHRPVREPDRAGRVHARRHHTYQLPINNDRRTRSTAATRASTSASGTRRRSRPRAPSASS